MPAIRRFSLFALMCWTVCVGEAAAVVHARFQTLSTLAVTNGLIRWWPNVFDLRDEVTGQEGMAVGVPPETSSEVDGMTPLDHQVGWVNLAPAITNEVFTIACWIYLIDGSSALFAQQSSAAGWLIEVERGDDKHMLVYVGRDELASVLSEAVTVPRQEWVHFAVARRPDGTSLIWTNGVVAQNGRRVHAWPGDSQWFTVGSRPRGGSLFSHVVQSLSVFDRVLGDPEVRALAAAGRGELPARETPARRRATVDSSIAPVRKPLVVADPKLWIHKQYTAEDGLPGNSVRAVLQDRNGYLWVGTDEGFARFDGRRFHTFTTKNTPALEVTGHSVYCFAEDGDGAIWAGTFGGIARIRGFEVAAFTNGLPQRFVLQLAPAGDGALWVGAFNNFTPRGPLWLRRYHPERGTTSAEVLVPGHLRSIHAAPNGLWLATEDPQLLLFWDTVSPSPRTVASIGVKPFNIRISRGATSLNPTITYWTDATGARGWAELGLDGASEQFLWYQDPRYWRPTVSRNPRLAGAREDWYGVSHGLARRRQDKVDAVVFTSQENGIEITGIWPDRERGVWFGTEHDGLHHVAEKLVRVYTAADGLPSDQIRAICTDRRGSLWIATANGHATFENGVFSTSGPVRLRSIAVDDQQTPWFGLGQGGDQAVRRGSPGSRTNVVQLPVQWQDPNTMRFARDGTLWIACELGITALQPDELQKTSNGNWSASPESRAFRRFAVGSELPICTPMGLVEAPDGAIWAGSSGAGTLFRVRDGSVVESFNARQGLDCTDVVPVHVDEVGTLWLVSDKGIHRMQRGRFQLLSHSEGIPNDRLLDMIADDLGNFWVSGKRGIHRLVRKEIEEVLAGKRGSTHVMTLGMRDGLLTPECTSLHYPAMAKTKDGNIWVATKNGLATFDPRRVSLDTQPLTVNIEGVAVGRKRFLKAPEATAARPLELAPGSGAQLAFHFGAASLLDADRIKFQYLLDGFDADWSEPTDLRVAFYTNLRPGAYMFKVKASNGHGVWSDRPSQLSFVVQPHFWQTRGFHGLILLLGFGLLLGWHFSRLHAHRRAERTRLQQALLNEKTRISEDMHDQLGAALTQIAILGEVAKTQYANSPCGIGTLDRISSAAREVTRSLSELVWATNPQNDTLENLLAYVRESAASQLSDTGLQLIFEMPGEVPPLRMAPTFKRNLLLMMREALHNVVKHASATEVTVRLSMDDASLRLEISDDGLGFSRDESAKRGNGLRNLEKRAAELGGEFHVISEYRRGTRLTFALPLARHVPLLCD
jgi:signal transduction histidine kinase